MLETDDNLCLKESQIQDYFLSLRQQKAPAARLPERIVSAVWFDGAFDSKNICTNDLRKIEIISPGRWNEGPGPDFLDAEIRISERKRLFGDVEIEVMTSDWDRHSHKKSSDYGNVILRVCLFNDINKPLKSKIPLLVLSPFIKDIEKLSNYDTQGYPFASPRMKGPCRESVKGTGDERMLRILEEKGRNRLETKAYRFSMLARTFGKEQTVYKGIMEALGYSMNKDPMSRLADAVNMEFIGKHIAPLPKAHRQKALEAALLAHCGAFSDDHTLERNLYLTDLKETWEEISLPNAMVIIEGFRLARTRPANNPFRRLAAMSQLMAKVEGFRLYRHIEGILSGGNPEAREMLKKLLQMFTSIEDDYWQEHSGVNPEPLKKPLALIGKGLALTIIANIIIPMALGTMNRKETIWKVAEELKGLPHNQKTRFTCVRILGPNSAQPPMAKRLLINQGLIQLFEDHCKQLYKDCPRCSLNQLS